MGSSILVNDCHTVRWTYELQPHNSRIRIIKMKQRVRWFIIKRYGFPGNLSNYSLIFQTAKGRLTLLNFSVREMTVCRQIAVEMTNLLNFLTVNTIHHSDSKGKYL
jgi:hypothetical protein